MPFTFTHPWWLAGTAAALAAVLWLSLKSLSSLAGWRRWAALATRLTVTLALGLALAGLRYQMPVEGLNVFFLLDRSDSVPGEQQEAARELVNRLSSRKKAADRGGVVVYGADAAIESAPNAIVDLQAVQAVVQTTGSDLSAAMRLATAAFPETGQRRIVVLSDGMETSGSAIQAALAARPLGVSVDVIPMGSDRAEDVLLKKVAAPSRLKEGQTFEVKIFAESARATSATLSLFRNDQLLGAQEVELQEGKNLFTFSQTLETPGFYTYDVRIDAPGDLTPQNNRATAFTDVRGEPRVLIVSSDPEADRLLAEALRASQLHVDLRGLQGFPGTLAEMQAFDAIFLCNVAAGDLSLDLMRLLQGAVRDFGVGLVAVGGDQAFAAGGYRGTPLEEALPVEMELSSKKVLPKGALVLVVHATEFPNGNQWAREIASAALQALGPQDDMGIVLWDGIDRWLFELSPVGDKREKGRAIMGMNPGDMPAFHNVMSMAHDALKGSTANLKHMVVFSDGDPAPPSQQLVSDIVANRVTISTVMIGGHVEPSTMIAMAEEGRGRFYDVRSPAQLPQVFIKEAAVILKAAISEEPFQPQTAAGSEITRGIGADEYPLLRGYVASTAKGRAEVPLLTDKGDPLLAHWQFGLGRAAAFTSDARTKWAADWAGWPKYRQFWSQLAQWALRRVDATEFNAEATVEGGVGRLNVEALDGEGNFRNFLNLQAVVVDPRGGRQVVRLQQMGPGRYEAEFPATEVGAYMMNLMDITEGTVRGAQTLGASVDYSPEFAARGVNLPFLRRLAEVGGGEVVDPADPAQNPYLRDRRKTRQPLDLWWWLLLAAVALFPVDVGIRRVQLERDEIVRAWQLVLSRVGWGRSRPATPQPEGLSTLLARKEQVRAAHFGAGQATSAPEELFQPAKEAVVTDDETRARKPEKPAPPKPPAPPPPAGGAAAAAPGEPTSATSRLLEAKRRAQKRAR